MSDKRNSDKDGGMDQGAGEVTALLGRLQQGDPRAAEELAPLVYDELRAAARRALRGERREHTLQATALVHEAWLRLTGKQGAAWQGRAHFLGVAARSMRQILIDHARSRKRAKRGGGWQRITLAGENIEADANQLSVDVLALHDALERLEQLSPDQARIVELRYFGGMTLAETAAVLEISTTTVENKWAMARAWLYRALEGA